MDRSTYSTGVEGIYAVGDIIGAPWLYKTHEAIVLVEQLSGKMKAINYENIPVVPLELSSICWFD